MKSVLISIKPQWCELIASGKKTIEVRKTKPKLETPFKVYVYETKASTAIPTFIDEDGHYIFKGRGQVIGEFICNCIASYIFDSSNNDIEEYEDVENSCLSAREILKYGNGECLYYWYISDLKIYDKPKELSKFVTVDKEAVKQCEHRERVYVNPDAVNGAWLKGSYVCEKGETNWCKRCKTKPLSQPPQSWCYVEECD